MYDNKTININANKLVIIGSVYTCHNLNALPSEIHPRTISRLENDTNVVFGGTLRAYNVLSNFYNYPFANKNKKRLFSSSEQAFQYGKACLFNDDASAQRIISTDISTDTTYIVLSIIKQIGKKISNFVSEKWIKKRELMTSILKDKFLKNEEMKIILRNTGTKILSEAIV